MFKRLGVIGAVIAVVVGLAVSSLVAGQPDYVSGKTSSDIVFSSSTVGFSVNYVSFYAKGSYAVVKTSIPVSNAASQDIYVDPGFDASYSPAFSMKGNSKRISVTLQPATTLYYYIGGVRE